jgi:SsrA-binding protein
LGGERDLAVNRRARFHYQILETFEAGLALAGTEVKSVRAGQASLAESWAEFRRGELFLVGAHVAPYEKGSYSNRDPLRPRKLLFHARELVRLKAKVEEKGLTLIPLRLYAKGPWIKLELALGRGKKTHDKREAIREKEMKRELRREGVRDRRRG